MSNTSSHSVTSHLQSRYLPEPNTDNDLENAKGEAVGLSIQNSPYERNQTVMDISRNLLYMLMKCVDVTEVAAIYMFMIWLMTRIWCSVKYLLC